MKGGESGVRTEGGWTQVEGWYIGKVVDNTVITV